jgi:hypothetical protein
MKKLREMFPNGMYTENSQEVFKRFRELLENDEREVDEDEFDHRVFCGLDAETGLDLIQYNDRRYYTNFSGIYENATYLTNEQFFAITLDDALKQEVEAKPPITSYIPTSKPYMPEIGEECEFLDVSANYKVYWVKVTPLFFSSQIVVLQHSATGNHFLMQNDEIRFRPLNTERDV